MFVYLQSQNRSYRSELPARRVGRSVRSFEIFAIRDVPKDERSAIWSDGRVARQRSAKPCTAVRIRFRPRITPSALQRGFSFSSPPRIFPEPCFFGIPLFPCFQGTGSSSGTVRRRPVPAGAERDVSGPAGRIARRRENRMPRACKARGIGIRGERGVSAPQGGKRRCRRSWRVWG